MRSLCTVLNHVYLSHFFAVNRAGVRRREVVGGAVIITGSLYIAGEVLAAAAPALHGRGV
ncbi:MAG TPA: hypothetical protein VIH35_08980 [Kiritimatiellia bacterium]|jgi:hypothetical protein